MTALTARNVHLSDQILAALTEESPLPISTMELWRKLRAGQPEPALADVISAAWSGALSGGAPRRVGYADVLRLLNRLARLGEVEKWPVDGDRRCCYWRRLSIRDGAS